MHVYIHKNMHINILINTYIHKTILQLLDQLPAEFKTPIQQLLKGDVSGVKDMLSSIPVIYFYMYFDIFMSLYGFMYIYNLEYKYPVYKHICIYIPNPNPKPYTPGSGPGSAKYVDESSRRKFGGHCF
jgi:hypothetical protein